MILEHLKSDYRRESPAWISETYYCRKHGKNTVIHAKFVS